MPPPPPPSHTSGTSSTDRGALLLGRRPSRTRSSLPHCCLHTSLLVHAGSSGSLHLHLCLSTRLLGLLGLHCHRLQGRQVELLLRRSGCPTASLSKHLGRYPPRKQRLLHHHELLLLLLQQILLLVLLLLQGRSRLAHPLLLLLNNPARHHTHKQEGWQPADSIQEDLDQKKEI